MPIVASVAATDKAYTWTLPTIVAEHALVRVADAGEPGLHDVSARPFSIFQGNTKQFTIVVLGSSTAAGAKVSKPDSAWVWRYRNYLNHQPSEFNVINLAVGGYTTASILPENNPEHNITKALGFNPDALIVNLPSNDAAAGRTVEDQMKNYEIIIEKAAQANIPLWVTTPQPRNFSQDKVQIQLGMIDATYGKFGEVFTVDFWTGFQTPGNTMQPAFDSGDGVHMNDAAHKIMFDRIVAENITGYLERNPLGVNEESSTGVRVFPNPTSGIINIHTSGTYNVKKVQLINAVGKLVFEKSGSASLLDKLDVTGCSKGLYYVHVYTNSGRFFSKILVQ